MSAEILLNRINAVIEARLIRIEQKNRKSYFSWDELLLTKTAMKQILRGFILIKKLEEVES